MGLPLLPEILGQPASLCWSEIADFEQIFARSSSALTASEKNSIHAFQWAQDEHRTLSVTTPQEGFKKAVSKIWTITAITAKRHEVGCQLLLITNRKSHTGFRLVLTSMTLNGVIALILRFFTEYDSSTGRLCHSCWIYTYNVRKIVSPSFSLPLLAKTNAPCSAVSLR